jgi:glycerol kinase
MLQCLADLTDAPIDRPKVLETTALGAAYLAGLTAGLYPEPDRFAAGWRLERRFAPAMAAAVRAKKRDGWRRAIAGTVAGG